MDSFDMKVSYAEYMQLKDLIRLLEDRVQQAETAVKIVQTQVQDALLLHTHMHDPNGWQTCTECKQDYPCRTVVMLTDSRA